MHHGQTRTGRVNDDAGGTTIERRRGGSLAAAVITTYTITALTPLGLIVAIVASMPPDSCQGSACNTDSSRGVWFVAIWIALGAVICWTWTRVHSMRGLHRWTAGLLCGTFPFALTVLEFTTR